MTARSFSPDAKSSSMFARYVRDVRAHKITSDAAQEAVVAQLGVLESKLARSQATRRFSLTSLLGGRAAPAQPIKGLYLFGDVGRGKTMLMDMFFATSAVKRKRRAHFHEFMSDVHDRVREYRSRIKVANTNGEDPIRLTAAAIAEETWLLCFDEFHVTDIADAM